MHAVFGETGQSCSQELLSGFMMLFCTLIFNIPLRTPVFGQTLCTHHCGPYQCFLGHNPDIHPLTQSTMAMGKRSWAPLRPALQNTGCWGAVGGPQTLRPAWFLIQLRVNLPTRTWVLGPTQAEKHTVISPSTP